MKYVWKWSWTSINGFMCTNAIVLQVSWTDYFIPFGAQYSVVCLDAFGNVQCCSFICCCRIVLLFICNGAILRKPEYTTLLSAQFTHFIVGHCGFSLWFSFFCFSILITFLVDGEPREIQFWIANTKGASYFSLAVHGQSLFR